MTSAKPLIDVLQKAIEKQFDIDKLVASFNISLNNHVTKKNNRPIFKIKGSTRRFMGKSKELLSAEKSMLVQMQNQAAIQNLRTPIKGPLWVIMHFYFPKEKFFTKKNEISKVLPDLSNLMQLPEDCLTNAGIIEDDSQIHSLDLSRRLVSYEYRLEVFILKYQDASLLPVRV